MEKTFKRTSRHLSDKTKQKISEKLLGKQRSDAAKAAISYGLKRYWNDDSNFPDDERHEGTGNGWIETGDVV